MAKMWDTILYIFLLILSILLYLGRYTILNRSLKILTVLQGCMLLATLWAIYLGYIVKVESNQIVYHILTPVQNVLYGLIFLFAISNQVIKRIIFIISGSYVIVSILISLTIQPWEEYNSYGLTINNVILAAWSLYYLWEMFSEVKIAKLESEPMFWVSTGLLFTSLGKFFAQGLMSYLISRSRVYALGIYQIEAFTDILLVIMFIIALLADKLFPSRKLHRL